MTSFAATTLSAKIDACWDANQTPDPGDLAHILDDLDAGNLRVAKPENGTWQTQAWVKKAILLFFKHTPPHFQEAGGFLAYDKVPLKCAHWTKDDFAQAGFRMAPGALVRKGAFVGPSVVLMPCFVNIGAFVDRGTMIDTMARVGSCAQVGKNCHISAGVGLGGVLEPPQASPVIIEDNCFIGAQSQVVEGVRIGAGAILGMGTFIGASTKIIDRKTGQIFVGQVPPDAVVVDGTYLPEKQTTQAAQSGQSHPPAKSTDTFTGSVGLKCAVIVRYASAKTREKVGINQLLREDSHA